jgi:hypothetical protein
MALFGTVLSAAVLFASCGPSAPRRTLAVGDDAITVASFNFPESVIPAVRRLCDLQVRVRVGCATRVVV